ncbi:MAG: hypothetical protein AB7N76_32160 [Planctomycetota bacterium]
MEELAPRLRAREGEVRCPYCHDHLAGEGEERITCPGCGTEHHVACALELRRCTTFGCERELEVEGDLPVDPTIQREIRARARDRVQRFLERNSREVRLDERYRQALLGVVAARARGAWDEARQAWYTALHLRQQLDPEQLASLADAYRAAQLAADGSLDEARSDRRARERLNLTRLAVGGATAVFLIYFGAVLGATGDDLLHATISLLPALAGVVCVHLWAWHSRQRQPPPPPEREERAP